MPLRAMRGSDGTAIVFFWTPMHDSGVGLGLYVPLRSRLTSLWKGLFVSYAPVNDFVLNSIPRVTAEIVQVNCGMACMCLEGM